MKKKFSFLLFIVLSFSIFAAPGGPGGGPGGDGRGGAGGFGGGSRGGPGSNPGTQPGGINRPDPPGREPAGGDIPPGGFDGPVSGHFEGSNYGDKNSDYVINFRGIKLELSDKEPVVLKSMVSDVLENKKKIVLYFNQTINSKSLRPEKILVNGEALEKSTKIKFNKRADSCSFMVEKDQITSIEITELEGYNGKISEEVKVKL